MIRQDSPALKIVRGAIPPTAQLFTLEYPRKMPAITIADFDGDGIVEIAAAYRFNYQPYIVVLKQQNVTWSPISTIPGKGYNVTYFNNANISSKDKKDLIVGWQFGAIWSELDILKWTTYGFKEIIPENLYFSRIDIEDMPGAEGSDGELELALWVHDTGEAYKVEVYRWDGDKLSPAHDIYPYYFKKVGRYYEHQVSKMPDAAFYWYYLSDALYKSGHYPKALQAVDKAIGLKLDYPSDEVLTELRDKILSTFNSRFITLYPANIKTADGVKWGYINSGGTFIIKPIYDYATYFQTNGLAIVNLNNHSGIIDAKGDYVIPPKYDSIAEFSEGRSVIIDNGEFKVIDESGNIITSKGYNYIGRYQNGRALFYLTENTGSSLYGYLDREGKEVIPVKYITATDFNKGKAVVQSDENTFSLIDLNGKVLSTYKYPFVGAVSDWLLSYKEQLDGKFGYIEEAGQVTLKPAYTIALPFENGRAVVNLSEDYVTNKYGLIDKKGKFIIKPAYNDIQLLGENRAAVGKPMSEGQPYRGSVYALADLDGYFYTDFIFNSIDKFKGGMASAADSKYTFFIDTKGKILRHLPVLEGSGTLSLEGELVKALVDSKLSYFDRKGNLIWTQNTVISLNNQYKINEEKYKPNRDYLVYYPQIKGMKNNSVQETVNAKLKELSQVKPIDSSEILDYSYLGNFNINFFKNSLLVLELYGYNFPYGAAHGMPTEIYPHIDLTSGHFYQLKDLFKPNRDYVKVLSDIIGDQIKNNPEYSYVFPDAYTGIQPGQPFYVNETTLFIYFNPYDIGPYAAGFPTFRISFTEIMDIIDTEGAFWKSFKS
nr:WG repeat-containing protein [Clostridium thermarum]